MLMLSRILLSLCIVVHWLAVGLAQQTMEDPLYTSPIALPTTSPTGSPAEISPTISPTSSPVEISPTVSPTSSPAEVLFTESPTSSPVEVLPTSPRTSISPTASPSGSFLFPVTDAPHLNNNVMQRSPTTKPTRSPTTYPSKQPTLYPSKRPTTTRPSKTPSQYPTKRPTKQPTPKPTKSPTPEPTARPSKPPTAKPSKKPTVLPTQKPTKRPITRKPSKAPTEFPTRKPSKTPTAYPTKVPTLPRPDNSTPYKIDFVFIDTDAEAQAVFRQAAQRWQQVIPRGFSSTAILPAGEYCGQKVENETTVYDMLIYVQIAPIDRSEYIVAQSQACMMDTTNMVRFGVIKLDAYDVGPLLEQGKLYNLVLHEMGHVLGLGSLWDGFNMVKKVRSPQGGYEYLKQFANQGNKLVGRDGPALVEDEGGRGISRGHWKESVYGVELMTGFIESAGVAMPLSKMTVLALKDLGYTVDESKADAYVAKPPEYAGRRLRGESESPRKRLGCLTDEYPIRQLDRVIPKPGQEDRFSKDVERVRRTRRRGGQSVP